MSEHIYTIGHAFTKGVYRDIYPAVNPKQTSVSKAGKIIMITGASRGIGRDGLAWAFATAGAKVIIITARKLETLKDTEELIKKINPKTDVLPVALETTNEESVATAFKTIKNKIGKIDILVNNAGACNSHGISLTPTDAEQTSTWWSDFDVNVRGTMLVTKHFLSLVGRENRAIVVYMSSISSFNIFPGTSAYSITKLANLQLAAFTAAENPNVTAIAFHPGIVLTDMVESNGDSRRFAQDTPWLAGAAVNWVSSEQAQFLNGRYMTANWDVMELLARKKEIVEGNLLTVGLRGLTGQTAQLRG